MIKSQDAYHVCQRKQDESEGSQLIGENTLEALKLFAESFDDFLGGSLGTSSSPSGISCAWCGITLLGENALEALKPIAFLGSILGTLSYLKWYLSGKSCA